MLSASLFTAVYCQWGSWDWQVVMGGGGGGGGGILKMFAAVKLYDKLRKWSKQIKYFNNNIQYMWPRPSKLVCMWKASGKLPSCSLSKISRKQTNNYLYYICNILTSSNLTRSKLTDKLCKLQHPKFSHLCCFWCCCIKTCIINTGKKVKMSMHHATSVRKYWWMF